MKADDTTGSNVVPKKTTYLQRCNRVGENRRTRWTWPAE